MKSETLCPVCGFELGFRAWRENSPSDEICPSCGIQFGYDDIRPGEFREGQYLGWRKKWIQDGYPWFSKNPKPENWDPEKQLGSLMDSTK